MMGSEKGGASTRTTFSNLPPLRSESTKEQQRHQQLTASATTSPSRPPPSHPQYPSSFPPRPPGSDHPGTLDRMTNKQNRCSGL